MTHLEALTANEQRLANEIATLPIVGPLVGKKKVESLIDALTDTAKIGIASTVGLVAITTLGGVLVGWLLGRGTGCEPR